MNKWLIPAVTAVALLSGCSSVQRGSIPVVDSGTAVSNSERVSANGGFRQTTVKRPVQGNQTQAIPQGDTGVVVMVPGGGATTSAPISSTPITPGPITPGPVETSPIDQGSYSMPSTPSSIPSASSGGCATVAIATIWVVHRGATAYVVLNLYPYNNGHLMAVQLQGLAQSFGQEDAYFGKDISFYVFSLPWWHYVVDFVMALAIISLLASAVVHYLYGGVKLQASRDRLSPAVRAGYNWELAQFSYVHALQTLREAGFVVPDLESLVYAGGRDDFFFRADLGQSTAGRTSSWCRRGPGPSRGACAW